MDRDLFGQRPTWSETSLGQRPRLERDPLEGTWDQAADRKWHDIETPPVDKMTDICNSITLPQTSFVGGKYTGANAGFPVGGGANP